MLLAAYYGHSELVVLLRKAVRRRPLVLRQQRMIQWRTVLQARTDVRYIFRCSRDGRPLELERRLPLGAKAGGLQVQGKVDGPTWDMLMVMLEDRPELKARL